MPKCTNFVHLIYQISCVHDRILSSLTQLVIICYPEILLVTVICCCLLNMRMKSL